MKADIVHIDCTLRDGGYYNNWDFPLDLIVEYLAAMDAAKVDYIELGLRSFLTTGFRGACAYTTDEFIRTLPIPDGLKVGVMMNAAELIKHSAGPVEAVKLLFAPAEQSPVKLVRFACHVHEFEEILPVCAWLKEAGYKVGINLMQVADRSEQEIEQIAKIASQTPPDVLYFADSMGSLNPDQTATIIHAIRRHWKKSIGIHTHDNMGLALSNTLRAIDEGVTWVDSTVTGMGRGPGNAKTEYLLAEIQREKAFNLVPLITLVRKRFQPMQMQYGWGSNFYYFLSGKYGIHPTYVQEMLADSRYTDEDIVAVIGHLQKEGGKKFSFNNLESGRAFFQGSAKGTWVPQKELEDREVLILATGPGVSTYRDAIEAYIRAKSPYVIALNINQIIDESLINARAACHPVRLLADCEHYIELKQPLICPISMLPHDVKEGLAGKEVLDFGLSITPGKFAFEPSTCTVPIALVIAYALAVSASGKASCVSLAGLDGYGTDDPRNVEMDNLLAAYMQTSHSCPIRAITPSRYRLPKGSVYQLTH